MIEVVLLVVIILSILALIFLVDNKCNIKCNKEGFTSSPKSSAALICHA